jgi:hypothetical protein
LSITHPRQRAPTSRFARRTRSALKSFILEKAFHREGRQGREGKQNTSLVIKFTDLVIACGFALALIPLASLAVQMLDLGLSVSTSLSVLRVLSAKLRGFRRW